MHALKLCGVDELHAGIGKTGIVAVIKGQATTGAPSRPMIGLRADMDALLMLEHNNFGWKPVKPGLMHNSCYDFNDSVLPLGAALFAGIAECSIPVV